MGFKIHASEHNAGTAFVTVDQHRGCVFMTKNFGKTWEKISGNLPQDDYVKVVRQDPQILNYYLLEWNTAYMQVGIVEKLGKNQH